jgi:hypothetical protein
MAAVGISSVLSNSIAAAQSRYLDSRENKRFPAHLGAAYEALMTLTEMAERYSAQAAES